MRSGFTIPKATARFPPKGMRKGRRQSSRGTENVSIICCVATRSNHQPSFGAPIFPPARVKSSCQGFRSATTTYRTMKKKSFFRLSRPDSLPRSGSLLWTAALPPRRIAANGESLPHFGPHNKIVFRLTDGQAILCRRDGDDGTGRAKRFPAESSISDNVSPDRRLSRSPPMYPNVTPPPTLFLPLDGGPPIQICNSLCRPAWSPDGRYLYLRIPDKSGQTTNLRTAAIPIPPGKTLPRLPPEAVRTPPNGQSARSQDR